MRRERASSRPEPVVSRNRIEHRSGRITMVVVEQATESLAPVHPAILVRWRWRALEQDVVQTLMVPLTMVVGEVLADGPPQMSFSQRHDPVEAFALDRKYNSLRVRVQVRTPRWQQHCLHPCPSQH